MFRAFFVLSFFSLTNLNGLAFVVPYNKDLPSGLKAKFDLCQEQSAISSVEAHQLLYETYSKSKLLETEEVAQWSFLNYVGSLMRNDSLLKSHKLLTDSSLFNWPQSPSWLKNFHAIRLAEISMRLGNSSEVERQLKGVLSIVQEEHLRLLGIKIQAENLMYQGKLDLSRLKWLDVIESCENLNDSTLLVESYLGRSKTYSKLSKSQSALRDIEFAVDFYRRRENQAMLASANSLLSIYNLNAGQYAESAKIALESYSECRSLSSLKGQADNLLILAKARSGLQNWNQSERYLNEALQLYTQLGEAALVPDVLLELGRTSRFLENLEKAEAYLKSARTKASNYGQALVLVNCFEELSLLASIKEQYQVAFTYQQLLIQVKDSLYNIERTNAIEDLEFQFKTEKAAQELEMLQKEKNLITNRWLTLALGLFLIIIIGILIYDNQKRKHRQETELLITEDELRKAEIKIMTEVLAHNQQKLSAYTDHLLKKNELVGELQDKVKTAVSDEDSIAASKLLNNISSVRILTEDDWEEFKLLFDGVHRGLLERLLSEFQNLTLAEQRLFLLMKLEMSTKQIANILGVSPESVKKGRYRLKKKLDLQEAQTLQDFVRSF